MCKPQDKCPYLSVYDIFYRCYPYKLFLAKEGQLAVESILETFNIPKPTMNDVMISKYVNVDRKNEEDNSMSVNIKHPAGEIGLNVSRLLKKEEFINLHIISQSYVLNRSLVARKRLMKKHKKVNT